MSDAPIYEALRLLRKRSGLSQKQVGEAVGLSQQAIALIENGKRKLDTETFKNIVNALGGMEKVETEFLKMNPHSKDYPAMREATVTLYVDKFMDNLIERLKESENEGIDNAEKANTIAAHFDGDEYTEDELEEIKQFAEFVKTRRKKDDA